MKPLKYLFAVAAIACCGITQVSAESTSTSSTANTTARVIVRFKANAASVKAQRMDLRMTHSQVQSIADNRASALGVRRGITQSLHAGRSLDERTQVITARGIDSATLASRLAKDADVEIVAVDQRRHIAANPSNNPPNDPCYGTNATTTTCGVPTADGGPPTAGQWYLNVPTSTLVSAIDAPPAWSVTFGSSSVVVAVVDTGVLFNHPDFTNVDGSSQFIATTDTTDFPSGYVGYDFISYGESGSSDAIAANNESGKGANGNAADPGDWVSQADITSGDLGSGCTTADIADSSWHGTHVSGLIAASTNNGVGMAGVAGGVKLLPVRVLGKCGGYDSDIIAGMLWAAGIAQAGTPTNPNPAKVLNMSLGGSGSCAATDSTGQLYLSAIQQVNAAGATIVVAAGNSNGEAVGVPGNCAGVITVAALRQVGTKVGFSSIGSQVALSAPGGNCVNVDANGNATGPCLYPILSMSNTGTQGPVSTGYDYDTGFGTSFSTPLVTGTVALMLSERPQLTPAQIKTLLTNTVRAFPTTGGSAGIAACVALASTSTQTQNECYCNTSTCGAGMLDTGAAVQAAQALAAASASITVSPTSPTVGQVVTLTATPSLATGRSVASYAWTLVSGGGAVTAFTSGTSSSTATLTPTAAGTISVQVVVTDDFGDAYTATQSVVVAASSGGGTSTTSGTSGSSGSTSSSSGGGGAFSPLWALGLMLAALALRPPRWTRRLARLPR